MSYGGRKVIKCGIGIGFLTPLLLIKAYIMIVWPSLSLIPDTLNVIFEFIDISIGGRVG